ncbi:nicotinamide-nucleotide amidase [Bosea sp. OAE506]|uniref:CinA family protein n=1 Tax=Bosea sp. OAE506 TaxID=2663870 RepID=UPI00178A750A
MPNDLPHETSEKAVEAASQRVLDALRERGWRLATAESCTAGRLAGALAAGNGAGSALQGGFVCYSKDAKVRMLGLPTETLNSGGGAVTETVARLMAANARERSGAEIAVAVTGVLGPSCDEDGNPVGLVDIACAREDLTRHRREHWPEAAPDILVRATILSALALVAEMLSDVPAAQEPTIVPPLG